MQTLEEKLEEILPLVLMHSKHDQPWVKVGSDRCNWKFFFGSGPSFASDHNSTLFQILANAIDDFDSQVQVSVICSPNHLYLYICVCVHTV